MAFALGFGKSSNESASSNQQWSGLGPEEKNAASRYFGNNRLYDTGNYYNSFLGSPVQNLPTLRTGPMGLFPEQMAGVDRLLGSLASKYSSNMAANGFLNPEASGAVVGSAFQNALPQLLGMGRENILSAFGSEVNAAQYPEAVRQARAAQNLDFWNTLQGLLGGYGSGSSTSKGSSMNLSGQQSSGSGKGEDDD